MRHQSTPADLLIKKFDIVVRYNGKEGGIHSHYEYENRKYKCGWLRLDFFGKEKPTKEDLISFLSKKLGAKLPDDTLGLLVQEKFSNQKFRILFEKSSFGKDLMTLKGMRFSTFQDINWAVYRKFYILVILEDNSV